MHQTGPTQRYMQELQEGIEQIWEVAQELGLRPFPTHFEIVPAAVMYEIGSYGMPGRFSHWTHGKAYQMQKTMYDYGLSKIYELVINTNPCYAFLLETNTVLQNKLVAAHVLAHSDFFANNAHFAKTSRRMVDTVSLNADRIRRYEFEHGTDEVERLLDAALSIQEHIDPYITPEDVQPAKPEAPRRPASTYDDLFRLDERGEPEPEPSDEDSSRLRPAQPVRDLLLFILTHSPRLDDWERDVVSIVRTEMLYFYPQLQTKIINEGWASYWHAQIMRELDLSTDEYLEFAQLHAAILQPSPRRINPYHLGYRILEDIERRANEAGEDGRAKLFEVREVESDVSLIRNYLTEELVEDLDLYLYQRVGDELVIVDKRWESVRERLCAQLTNHGFPVIQVEDGDYNGNSELYLRHVWDGEKLDLHYAQKTMEHIYRLWDRRIWLETRKDEDEPLILSYDAREGHKIHT
ncbi:SpoVR family protein [Sphaerobacter thermophilus]|uniref:SpoVR family protein n=1 Tax=Sphaerobacter thermophilus (strain ATCC 49802 / DSM 20745 / KCCM 41009 / NCIMB 13125 / S 6022) TaxID=479434 RepID=D1CA35_SPHTD|nr:SpoVR family protein [Sphaerobacter thermophilus]ACZ40678.1 SpoVR family protein [Sphaerobacter thermophilus DSM 20745]